MLLGLEFPSLVVKPLVDICVHVVPDVQWIIHEVDEEQKKEALCHHSEKLAVAYRLIRTPRTSYLQEPLYMW